jgi:hypothetical protein
MYVSGMTTSRYEAHIDPANPKRVICVDRLAEHHAVVTFTDAQADALVNAAQRFLDAGIARYGSLDEFDRACRWMLDLEKFAKVA